LLPTITTGGQKLVAIGGGTGLSCLLGGLKRLVGKTDEEIWIESLSAIVTVSDDGGSSGRLREELQMLPPGDIRNCMIALSEDSTLLARLFRYRFRGDGELGGHSFGNLFLAALTEVTGDFTEAIRVSSEILASKGHIYPATISDVRLAAELEDGSVVRGETQISASKVRFADCDSSRTVSSLARRHSKPFAPPTSSRLDQARSTPASCRTCS
jgi:uncharacterized cofD-like protein